MAMTTVNIQSSIATLSTKLSSLGTSMRVFSYNMRSLYVDKAVGTNSQAAREMRQLRDDTRNDAVIYLQCVLPVVTTHVAETEEFFRFYKALSMEEWWDNIDHIIKETIAHKETCHALITIHQRLLTNLKEREDVAIVVTEKLSNLAVKYEGDVEKLRASAESYNDWAAGLALLPIVNIIACPILKSYANSEAAEAVAKKTESEIHFAVAKSVTEVLIPALRKFIDGLESIAGFFEVVHQELSSFEKRGNSAKEASKPMILHYKMMNETADGIINDCKGLYSVLPSIRTDFAAIPTEGTNQNYVDEWLKEQKEIIWKACSLKEIAKKLINAIPKAIQASNTKMTSDATEH